jgi:hypothetical protein
MKTIQVSEAEYRMILEARDAREAERLYDMETVWKHREQRSIDQCGDDYGDHSDIEVY